LDASSLHRSAGPGAGAIEATGTSSGSNDGFPYTPPGQSADTGTGLVIETQGDILTASHVVAGAATITAKFQNGPVRTASVRGTDTSNDISVLHVNRGLTPSAAVGERPVAARRRSPRGDRRRVRIQPEPQHRRGLQAWPHDPGAKRIPHRGCAADRRGDPGNSDGPVLDAQGQVAGIADQIATGGSGVDQGSGVGFAIPIDPSVAVMRDRALPSVCV
jgi:putative serine protease PepD